MVVVVVVVGGRRVRRRLLLLLLRTTAMIRFGRRWLVQVVLKLLQELVQVIFVLEVTFDCYPLLFSVWAFLLFGNKKFRSKKQNIKINKKFCRAYLVEFELIEPIL